MTIKLSKAKRNAFIGIISIVVASLLLGHPMADEKLLAKNIWDKFTKDHNNSLIKQVK